MDTKSEQTGDILFVLPGNESALGEILSPAGTAASDQRDTESPQQDTLSILPGTWYPRADTSYLPGYIGSLLADTLSAPSGNLFPRADISFLRQGTVY